MATADSQGAAEYGRQLRAVARALWLGALSVEQFYSSMLSVIDAGLTRAMREGLAECGFEPDEAGEAETRLLFAEISQNLDSAWDLGEYIASNAKAEGGKWGAVTSRLEMWQNRYPKLRVEIAAQACADRKMEWALGATEEHCASCFNFAGRVYRYSVWAKNGALPQSQKLCCKGYRCDCRLSETDKRITPGRFPASLLCN